MNKLKKSLALIAVLAISGTMFVACKDDSSTGGTTTTAATTKAADSTTTTASSEAPKAAENKFSDDGKEMTLLCWTPDDVTKMIENFTGAKSEYKDKIIYKNVGSKGQEAREQYITYFAGGDDVDLFVMEADWILDYINTDKTSPITDLGFNVSDFDGAYDYTVAIGTNKEGVLKGVSWQATPGAYVYNVDLAKEYLGAKTPDEMQAFVKDWKTFEESAKTVKDKSAGKCAMADTLGGMWQVYQYNKSAAWADKSNKLVVDDYCKDYAELAKRFYDNGYVTKETQWSDGWKAIGQDGSTMGYFFCTWCLGKGGQLEGSEGGEGGKTYGKYAITLGPSSWAWGGSWLGVSPKCNTGKAAHDFVEYFTVNEKTMEDYALFKSEFVNNEKVMKKIVDDKSNKNALLGGQDQFSVLYEAAAKIDMDGKITSFDSQIKDAFNSSVDKYVKAQAGYEDTDKMISEFKKAAAKIEGLTVE